MDNGESNHLPKVLLSHGAETVYIYVGFQAKTNGVYVSKVMIDTPYAFIFIFLELIMFAYIFIPSPQLFILPIFSFLLFSHNLILLNINKGCISNSKVFIFVLKVKYFIKN